MSIFHKISDVGILSNKHFFNIFFFSLSFFSIFINSKYNFSLLGKYIIPLFKIYFSLVGSLSYNLEYSIHNSSLSLIFSIALANISLALPCSLSIISSLAAEIHDKGFSGLVVIKLFNNNFAFFIS